MSCELTAYPVEPTEGWRIEPASPRREWMDQNPARGAYRCLPLSMANQAGWVVRSPVTVKARWNGGANPADLAITFPEGGPPANHMIASHFGSGILTFRIPWLFRTSPGYGIFVRGPTNEPRDGAWPLDGVVETDWAPYTFTMNWKLMRRASDVWFKKGDAVCMISPYPLGMLEGVKPTFADLDSNPDLAREYDAFVESRTKHLEEFRKSANPTWQLKYFRGVKPDGTEWEGHRSNFKLAPFSGMERGG